MLEPFTEGVFHETSHTTVILLIALAAPALADYLDVANGAKAYNKGRYNEAFRIFQKEAKGGDVNAQNYLGVMYDKGQGIPSRKSLLVGHKRMMEPAVPVSVWCSGKATLETRRNSMKNVSLFAVVVVGLTILVYQPTMAGEFAFTFKWGGIPLCDDGSPNDVSNPIFTLSGVPTGTKEIEFEMIDLDAPSYQHGGGTVKYTGQKVIEKGAFEYESPCPPGETHTYEWQANAKDANGDSIGKATARTNYPK